MGTGSMVSGRGKGSNPTDRLEGAVRREASEPRLKANLEALAQWHRHSGTPDEDCAAQYVAQTLASHGVPVTVYRFPSFLGLPESGRLIVLGDGAKEVEVVAHSFSASTNPAGLEALVTAVGRGSEEEFSRAEVGGRVALVNSMSSPEKVLIAKRCGAIAVLFVSFDDVLRQTIATTIWGTPTPEKAHLIPGIPVLTMKRSDGQWLTAACQARSVSVRVIANTYMGWKEVPLVVADIAAPGGRQDFMLLASHLDSWQVGAMDNASGDVCSVEAAIVFHKHRDQLRRGLRIGWWPGHSTGRYSGSTWYVDNFWEELEARCVATISVDQIGFVGNTRPRIRTFAEFAPFAQAVIREVAGRDIPEEGVDRNNDQSYWGIGISSLCYGSWDEDHIRAGLPGPTWFWHSPQDTLDKIVWPRLRADTEVVMTMIARLATELILPFDFTPVASQFVQALRSLAPHAASLPFAAVAEKAEAVRGLASSLNALRYRELPPAKQAVVSDCIKSLARILNPALHTIAGRWEHDPAASQKILPTLQRAVKLSALPPGSTDAQFLMTALRRDLNRIADALNRARRRIETTLEAISV